MTIDDLSLLPEHLAALQLLINRCGDPESRKHLVVAAGSSGAITPDEAVLVMTANQLETA